MERIFDIQATLSGDVAEVYAAVVEAFESKGNITLSAANCILLQTGAIQHLTMLQGLGLLEPAQNQAVTELVELIKTQRIFQMNSQSIQAADEALRVVASLRR